MFGAPAIDGLGTTGGFKLQVQDRSGAGLRALQGSVQNLADQGNADPRLVGLFSSFTVNQPQLFVEIDRDKLKAQKVSLDDVNQTLQAYLGGLYVNDVTLFNRNWQVNVQADARFRMRVEDIGRLEVRNAEGERVPLATLVNITDDSGPAIVNHYNSLSFRRIERQHGSGHQFRPGGRHHGPTLQGVAPLDHGGRLDGDHAPADPRRSQDIHASWPSRWRWSSCSWCWRRSMKAGLCRCRSF